MSRPVTSHAREALRASGRSLRGLVGGEPVPLGIGWGQFFVLLLQTSRPHFFAYPAGACLVGVAVVGGRAAWATLLATAACGLGWGIGQLVNDVLDVETDAVSAPDRAVARGLLPVGPTLLAALALGLGVLVVVSALHRFAIAFALGAVPLMLGYNLAKSRPVWGNLMHGLLVALAAALGVLAAEPDADLAQLANRSWRGLLYCGLVAVIYLQSNYEKDLQADLSAGYRTLAAVLGVRLSAAARAVASLGVLGWASGWLLLSPSSLGVAGLGAALIVVSAGLVAVRGTERAALGAYPVAVFGGQAMMLGPAFDVLGSLWAGLGLGAALSLLVLARLRSENP